MHRRLADHRPTGVRRRRRFVACVVAAVAVVASVEAAYEPPWQHIPPRDPTLPLPSASVQRILQDRQQFIWLGLFGGGLARFDGTALDRYGTSDGLPDPTVRELAEDAAGHLWVGCDTGLVMSDRPLADYGPGERVRFVATFDGVDLLRTRIRRGWLNRDSRGAILAGSPDGALTRYRLAADGLRVETIAPPAPDGVLSAVADAGDGELWIALEDASLATLTGPGGGWQPIPRAALPSAPVTAFIRHPDGRLWVGARDGSVWRQRDGSRGFDRVDGSLSEQVSALTVTRDGSLWASTLGSGALIVTTGGEVELIGRASNLPSETVWDVVEDHEGSVWLGHNAGLSRLAASWRAFDILSGQPHGLTPPTLPDPTTFSVTAAQPGDPTVDLWVGTGGGLVAVRDGYRVGLLDTREGLPSSSVYSLARAGPRLWIGTPDGLAALVFDAAATQSRRRVSVAGRPAWLELYGLRTVYQVRPVAPARERPGHVWVAGTGGLELMTENRVLHLGPSHGLPAAGTTCSATDAAGVVWVGTKDTGVLRSHEPIRVPADRGGSSQVQFVPVWNRQVGAPSDAVNDLALVGDRLWVATGGGLAALASRGPDPGAVELELPTGPATAVAWDATRSLLWAAAHRALIAIDPVSGAQTRTVTARDGLVDDEIWHGAALSVTPDGDILLGTPRGVTVYHPDLDRRPPASLTVRIREASYQENESGGNRLAIRYSALSYAGETSVRYRTRLVGLDERWSEPTTDVRARYTNLGAFFVPRDYRFEVVAETGAGDRSAIPATWSFRVSPPWWLRWWSLGLGLVGLVVTLAAVDAVRTQQLTRRTRQLESLVAARTEELQRHARVMETLDRIVESVNREVELDRVMAALLEHGLELLPRARRGVFLIRDASSGRFRVSSVSGWGRDLPPGGSLSEDEARQRFTGDSGRLDVGVYGVHRLKDRSGTTILDHLGTSETLLTLDLPVAGEIEGFLVFELDPDADGPESTELALAQRYRQHAITALAKARIVHRLEEARREAAAASEAKSRFLATMSHELRTPLNSIIGFSEILVERSEDHDERQVRFLTNILTSGRHLLAMINDILDLAKIEAGRMHLEPEEVELEPLIDGVTRILGGVAAKAGVQIETQVSDEVPTLWWDAPKVKQVLHNLLSNAVRYSPRDGVVRISARPTLAGGTEGVEIEVSDQGPGIRPEDRERIFGEFIQARAGGRGGGAGLGLALVRRSVELHDGEVSVDCTPGEGATFRVVLPVDVRAGDAS